MKELDSEFKAPSKDNSNNDNCECKNQTVLSHKKKTYIIVSNQDV